MTSNMDFMMVTVTLHWREAYWRPLPHREPQVQAPLHRQPPWTVDPVTIRWWMVMLEWSLSQSEEWTMNTIVIAMYEDDDGWPGQGDYRGPEPSPSFPCWRSPNSSLYWWLTFHSLISPPWLLTGSLPKFSPALPLLLELFHGCFQVSTTTTCCKINEWRWILWTKCEARGWDCDDKTNGGRNYGNCMIAAKKMTTCNLKDKHGATKSPSSGTFVRADRIRIRSRTWLW